MGERSRGTAAKSKAAKSSRRSRTRPRSPDSIHSPPRGGREGGDHQPRGGVVRSPRICRVREFRHVAAITRSSAAANSFCAPLVHSAARSRSHCSPRRKRRRLLSVRRVIRRTFRGGFHRGNSRQLATDSTIDGKSKRRLAGDESRRSAPTIARGTICCQQQHYTTISLSLSLSFSFSFFSGAAESASAAPLRNRGDTKKAEHDDDTARDRSAPRTDSRLSGPTSRT